MDKGTLPISLSATPLFVAKHVKERLDDEFAITLFDKQNEVKPKTSKERWNRPYVKLDKNINSGTGGISVMPPNVPYKYLDIRRKTVKHLTPLLEGVPLAYEMESFSYIIYRFSVRSESEKFRFVEYAANSNNNPVELRNLIHWHFKPDAIRRFCLLPDFFFGLNSRNFPKLYTKSWNAGFTETKWTHS